MPFPTTVLDFDGLNCSLRLVYIVYYNVITVSLKLVHVMRTTNIAWLIGEHFGAILWQSDFIDGGWNAQKEQHTFCRKTANPSQLRSEFLTHNLSVDWSSLTYKTTRSQRSLYYYHDYRKWCFILIDKTYTIYSILTRRVDQVSEMCTDCCHVSLYT